MTGDGKSQPGGSMGFFAFWLALHGVAFSQTCMASRIKMGYDRLDLSHEKRIISI